MFSRICSSSPSRSRCASWFATSAIALIETGDCGPFLRIDQLSTSWDCRSASSGAGTMLCAARCAQPMTFPSVGRLGSASRLRRQAIWGGV